jgi:hypothetical protein
VPVNESDATAGGGMIEATDAARPSHVSRVAAVVTGMLAVTGAAADLAAVSTGFPRDSVAAGVVVLLTLCLCFMLVSFRRPVFRFLAPIVFVGGLVLSVGVYRVVADHLVFQAPTGLQSSEVTSESAKLSWQQHGAPAASYTIAQIVDSGSEAEPGAIGNGSNGTIRGTAFTVTKLMPGHLYKLFVNASSESGQVLSSDPVEFTTMQQAPQPGSQNTSPLTPVAPPSGLKAMSADPGVVLTWNRSAAPGIGYRILRNDIPVATVPIDVTTFTDTAVPRLASLTYTLREILRDDEETADGKSATAVLLSGTPIGPPSGPSVGAPSAPREVLVTATTRTSVSIAWHAPADLGATGIRSYEVFVDGVLTDSTPETTDTIVGLRPASTYRIEIRASDADGLLSVPSAPVTVTTATAGVTYPEMVGMNRNLTCQAGCWATDLVTTVLSSATVTAHGEIELHVIYTNHTTDSIDIVFDPPLLLTDNRGNSADAFSDVGGTGFIPVPPGGSTAYTIQFSGLDPAPGTSCTFSSDIEQGGDFTIYYEDVAVPCG